MRNTYSLNSRGSSSLRRETSLVMMLESQPSCWDGNEFTKRAFEKIFIYNQHPEVVFGYFSAFPFQEFHIEILIRQSVVFSHCFVMSQTYFAKTQYNIFREKDPCTMQSFHIALSSPKHILSESKTYFVRIQSNISREKYPRASIFADTSSTNFQYKQCYR